MGPKKWTRLLAHAKLPLEMPEDPENEQQSDKPAAKPVEATVRPGASGKLTVTGQVRVRLIQSSPDEDPELVEKVREFERELKEKGEQEPVNPNPEAPFILMVEK